MSQTPTAKSKPIDTSALETIVGEFTVDSGSTQPVELQQSIAVARRLQERAVDLQTPQERRQQAELDRMIQNPHDKVTLTQLTDQAFRSKQPHRAVDQLVHILDVQGIPRFFTPIDRALLKGFQSFGSYLPGVAVSQVKKQMREETANVILPAERELLTEHLRNRRDEHVRMNVNFLGEALLGEDEAQNRLKRYLQALQLPEIEVMSVKISTIYSQISTLGRHQTLSTLCDRLEMLYRASAKSTFRRADGSTVKKFVYLDMEEYRDLDLTTEVFVRTLERPGLENVSAGIVLQSYIPDSYRYQARLLDWAKSRVSAGGAPITIRIVKGANMEMERFEAALFGWPQAPYKTKTETDANFRRMVRRGLEPENARVARLGIASHNLFEVAYGLVLALGNEVFPYVQFEMLEGMANHQRRALCELFEGLLLYAPACRKEDFINAIGYLVRRLDENTGPDNFLRHAFSLKVGSEVWNRLEQQFVEAHAIMDTVSDAPRRTQDRRQPTAKSHDDAPWQEITLEPDTDFSLPHNVTWAEQIVSHWQARHGESAMEIPLTVAGERVTENRQTRKCYDPSRPGVVVGRYSQANDEDVDLAVKCAVEDTDGWRNKSAADRRDVLQAVARELRQARATLIGAAMADGGKTISESDPEVSEAVDFAEFYSKTAVYYDELPGVTTDGRGVVVVVSPWNFPIAIPCGGVAAALAAGNTAILKPASDTVLVAHELCQCFWRAGVSTKTLQMIPCAGATEGQQLVTHPGVDTVILTGGTDTAMQMLEADPQMRLLAETGGKNATIVTGMADRDQAIKNLLHSAFGHSGQKCSATSLLILEAEVFEDEAFKRALCDAVESLEVGSAWNLKTKVGPLIRPPSGDLENALKELEPSESWAVIPQRDAKNPGLYSPAVKWGVQPGSYTHCTEFFGPVLGVMKATNIHEAIDLVNQTGYGLTSGIESLDDREIEIWRDAIRAGNLYINRGTTGAVVLRQPFGGMGKSAFGPGIKAGGPNYVTQLMRFRSTGNPPGADVISDPALAQLWKDFKTAANDQKSPMKSMDASRLHAAIASYQKYSDEEFGGSHDHFKLVGQDNFRRYLPVRELRIRVHPDDTPFDIVARVCAAKIVGCRITVSTRPESSNLLVAWLDEATESWAGAIEFVEESDEGFAGAILDGQTLRTRYADPSRVSTVIRKAAAKSGMFIADEPVLDHGRLELLWYLEEQSISNNYHRYGNLGQRSEERRAPVL
jgi:RHH-type proline utilization regulon transcriptional repressor/proline dehydrogenase/delta 1-pyrroline-5-carboxylate dehydrogenase